MRADIIVAACLIAASILLSALLVADWARPPLSSEQAGACYAFQTGSRAGQAKYQYFVRAMRCPPLEE